MQAYTKYTLGKNSKIFAMPLVLMCGFPSSGKTHVADKLRKYFEDERGKRVHLIGDDSIGIDRNVTYATSNSEKEARGSLKSAVERLISREDIIILDSLNYIKGYRYELYCVAKAHKTPHCVIHCDTPKETCSKWNQNAAEAQEKQYTNEMMEALIMRFEAPDSRNRWDSPLFTIQVGDEIPREAIYDSLINRIPPPPNQATQCQPLSSSNFLYELDRITQDIVTALLNSQKTFVPGDHVAVPGAREKVELSRQVNMAELRRIRRQFIIYAKSHPVEDTGKISNMFVQYLNNSFK